MEVERCCRHRIRLILTVGAFLLFGTGCSEPPRNSDLSGPLPVPGCARERAPKTCGTMDDSYPAVFGPATFSAKDFVDLGNLARRLSTVCRGAPTAECMIAVLLEEQDSGLIVALGNCAGDANKCNGLDTRTAAALQAVILKGEFSKREIRSKIPRPAYTQELKYFHQLDKTQLEHEGYIERFQRVVLDELFRREIRTTRNLTFEIALLNDEFTTTSELQLETLRSNCGDHHLILDGTTYGLAIDRRVVRPGDLLVIELISGLPKRSLNQRLIRYPSVGTLSLPIVYLPDRTEPDAPYKLFLSIYVGAQRGRWKPFLPESHRDFRHLDYLIPVPNPDGEGVVFAGRTASIRAIENELPRSGTNLFRPSPVA